MDKTIHAYICGIVQGVWYRDSTVAEAKRIGVNGWVRNMRDGRVEMVAQGESNKVDELIKWCWQGPERAEVSDIEIQDLNEAEEFNGFIRRPTA